MRVRAARRIMMSSRGRRLLWLAAALLAGLVLAGCDQVKNTAYAPPAKLVPIPGTDLHRVTLTEAAVADLGIKTVAVAKAASAVSPSPAVLTAPALTVIPVTAVIYDPQGKSWTYTIAGPRTIEFTTVEPSPITQRLR